MNVTIRPTVSSDVESCGRIIYEAFKGLSERHGFQPHFPSLSVAVQYADFCIRHPLIFGIVIESENRMLGSIFLDERNPIRGLGPITVDPQAQGRGIGRRLMEVVLERACRAVGVRLVQDSYNMLSISLYASLGFEVKEPLLLVRGTARSVPSCGIEVRPLRNKDIHECATLCEKVHGLDRFNEIQESLTALSPIVAVRNGCITGYALDLKMWPRSHAVAENEDEMKSLLLGGAAMSPEPVSFLLPTRQASLFHWCLDQGFRAVLPMTLMAIGKYQDPNGCYFPSILY